MKKLVLIAVFLLGFSVIVMAEDTPKVEVFGGFSYVKVDSSTALKRTKYDWLDLSMKGCDGSIAINQNKWAGVVVDFGANYGVVATNPSNPISGSWMDYRIHVYYGWPEIYAVQGEGISICASSFWICRSQALGVECSKVQGLLPWRSAAASMST